MIYDFTLDEQARLSPYVTNTDRSIFGLRNLPEAVKAALFARYSRTNKDLRRVLLDEFLPSLHRDGLPQHIFDTAKADAFHNRVINEYGDDSVAELGGAHIAIEGVSQLTALALCDNRIGMSPLVKSTRYVDFGHKINGRYQYDIPTFENPTDEIAYCAAMDGLFAAYGALQQPLMDYLMIVKPRSPEIDEKPYQRAIKARALDALRGLLPLGAMTNLGLYGNGRAFDHLLAKLQASEHPETMLVGYRVESELNQLIPSLIKKRHHRQNHSRYLIARREAMEPLGFHAQPLVTRARCQLIDCDADAVVKVVAEILYPHTNFGYNIVIEAMRDGQYDCPAIIRDYLGLRPTRHVRPGRAFESTDYVFEIVSDIGCYRDLQRHRMVSQSVQEFTSDLGYAVPDLVYDANLYAPYADAIDGAIAYHTQNPTPYAIPMAMHCRYKIKMNLREAYHFVELRSQGNGHPSYRKIAQSIYAAINAVHPVLAAGMTFVDMDIYELGRLTEK